MTLNAMSFINEKGNVSAKVRNSLKKQVEDKLKNLAKDGGLAVEDNVNGGFSIPVGIDKSTNDTIYAHVALTVSMADPAVKVEKGSKSKTVKDDTAEDVVPLIFD